MAEIAAFGLDDFPDAAESAVPISQLGEGSSVVRDVVASGRPKIVSEDGVGVAAILDMDTYRAVRDEVLGRTLLTDLRHAIAQADAGDLIDHNEVMDIVREMFRGRVSPATQRRLDRL